MAAEAYRGGGPGWLQRGLRSGKRGASAARGTLEHTPRIQTHGSKLIVRSSEAQRGPLHHGYACMAKRRGNGGRAM